MKSFYEEGFTDLTKREQNMFRIFAKQAGVDL
jgi:hypothetical protein